MRTSAFTLVTSVKVPSYISKQSGDTEEDADNRQYKDINMKYLGLNIL